MSSSNATNERLAGKLRANCVFAVVGAATVALIQVLFFGPSHSRPLFVQRLQTGRFSSGSISQVLKEGDNELTAFDTPPPTVRTPF
jgi:hypothetical protein